MGKVKRNLFGGNKNDNTGGPGMYDVEVKKDAPSYTIGTKSPDRVRHDSPGPGAYEAQYDAVKEANRS